MKSIIKSGSPKNVENRPEVRPRRHVAGTVREYNLSVKNSAKEKSLKNPCRFLIILKLAKDLDVSRKKLTDRTKDTDGTITSIMGQRLHLNGGVS